MGMSRHLPLLVELLTSDNYIGEEGIAALGQGANSNAFIFVRSGLYRQQPNYATSHVPDWQGAAFTAGSDH